MNKTIYFTYRFVLRQSSLKCFVFILILAYLIGIISGLTAKFLGIPTGYVEIDNPIVAFIFAVFVSPLIETAIFQALIISVLEQKNIKPLCTIIISGIIFGIAHGFYSFFYVVSASVFGMVLACCYLLFKRKGNYAFAYTMAVHALVNLIAALRFF
ncbi:CPBP family glutamic-type intramembrane protease [Parapedobacter sp. DT-150]|uniref:CPBP family glutamic-type intramembrane protease n=1 Tax=Parapedobacter sp. DT-150 TaxID=3396162 RepID=UPI003F1D35F5